MLLGDLKALLRLYFSVYKQTITLLYDDNYFAYDDKKKFDCIKTFS